LLATRPVAIPGRLAPNPAATRYSIIALLGYKVCAGRAWQPPAFPPLVIAGAIAIDLLRARAGRLAHPLALGLAFTVAFVAAELMRMLVFAPPGPSSALGGVEPRLHALYFPYHEQTVAPPWR